MVIKLSFFLIDSKKKDETGSENKQTETETKADTEGNKDAKEEKNITATEEKKSEKTPVISKLREPLITQLPLNKSNKTSEYSAYVGWNFLPAFYNDLVIKH